MAQFSQCAQMWLKTLFISFHLLTQNCPSLDNYIDLGRRRAHTINVSHGVPYSFYPGESTFLNMAVTESNLHLNGHKNAHNCLMMLRQIS